MAFTKHLLCIAAIALIGSTQHTLSASDNKQAEREAREAEYYKRQSESYRREAEYYLRETESARKEAIYYIRQGNASRASDYQRRARNAINSYQQKIDAAKRADERVDYHLQRAVNSLKR